MESDKRAELKSFLEILPPVDFCCIYGSVLHPNNLDKTSMIDYIIGVQDPQQWHAENLNMNRNHYASWMMRLGGARLITNVADAIGVGVHFNPLVAYNDKTFKYGVVRMHDLIQDIRGWERFYLGGRLQKPVNILVDNLDIENLNCVNLKAATSAALLLLPSKFSEDELYSKICSLSYMGDLRMHFAEDRNKVKKIVHGQLKLFQTMYKPFLKEYAAKDLLRLSIYGDNKVNITQVSPNSQDISPSSLFCFSVDFHHFFKNPTFIMITPANIWRNKKAYTINPVSMKWGSGSKESKRMGYFIPISGWIITQPYLSSDTLSKIISGLGTNLSIDFKC